MNTQKNTLALIVDDEAVLVTGLKKSLIQEGFDVLTAEDGEQAMRILARSDVDIIILDLMLPKIDGMTVCRRIRETADTPIIMLTARDDVIDKVMGLELGADDYLTKPFHTRELLARMRSILRRRPEMPRAKKTLDCGPVKIDTGRRTVRLHDALIDLTAREFDILKVLAENPGEVFSRERLFEIVWGEKFFDTRNIDVHISRLREKLEKDPKHPELLLTSWGVGYYLNAAPSDY